MKAFFVMFLVMVSLSFHLTPLGALAADKVQHKSTGDIDMNQFKNLNPNQEREKRKDSRIKLKMTCTDAQGHLIKKGEVGFDTCLSQTQTPLNEPPLTPEQPNDP